MSSKVLGLHPQVNIRRKYGPDFRVHKNDVENLMTGKLLVAQNTTDSSRGYFNRACTNPIPYKGV